MVVMDERATTTEERTSGSPAQLRLIDRPAGWGLDRETRERGLEGVARARRILEGVRPAAGERLPRAS